MATIHITIDGKTIQAESGMTVLEVARQANIHIPTLCYHPSLPPDGACRVCLVQIKGSPTLQTACTFPITEGMEVSTNSPEIIMARKTVVELLLSDHPLDCMTCESAGDCELRDLAYEFNIQEPSIPPTAKEKSVVDPDPNPFIYWDMNKCVLCRRCVRACHHIEGADILTVSERGFPATITTAFEGTLEESACEFCGNAFNSVRSMRFRKECPGKKPVPGKRKKSAPPVPTAAVDASLNFTSKTTKSCRPHHILAQKPMKGHYASKGDSAMILSIIPTVSRYH